MATAPAKKTTQLKPSATAARKPGAANKPVLAAVKLASEGSDVDASQGEKSSILRMRELISRVSENHGYKKKDVKEIIEAAFAEMAKALDNKENMLLHSLGKVRIVRQGDVTTGVPMTLKLRRSNPNAVAADTSDNEGLADDGEDS